MEQTLRGGGAAGDMAEGLGRPLPSPVTKMERASTTADHLGEQQQQHDNIVACTVALQPATASRSALLNL